MNIFKQVIILLVASLLVVVLQTQIAYLLNWVAQFHTDLLSWLSYIFSMGQVGLLLQKIFAIFIIPFAVVAAMGLIFWIFRRREMPYLVQIAWALWFVVATVVVMTTK